ncbi:MAG: response regulator [Deltaproteobacteria bacterium]|nr:response regulator [Deltaproteobacteria bacterium]
MTVFALISLLSFVFAVFLAAFLFFRDTGNILSRLFLLVTMSVAYTSLMEFGYRQADSFEAAAVWWRFDVLWSVHVSAWLHLTLAFTRPGNWLRRKWLLVALYAPSAVFIFSDIFFHAVTGPPREQPWGWEYTVQDGIMSTLLFIWMFLVTVACAILYTISYHTASEPRKKKQSRFLLIASVAPAVNMVVGILTAHYKWPIPALDVIMFIFSNTIIAYALWKYELFQLSVSRAAESIIATMGDSLLLVGLDSTIITVNKATIRMLGYAQSALSGKSVLELFSKDALIPEWIRELDPKKADTFQSRDVETEYVTATGRVIPISLSGAILYDENKDLRGFLLIAKDITEQKKTAQEITRHRERLEELVAERTKQLEQEMSERQKVETSRRQLESQLHQAQKMEAIGRLAGGVAHDFSNLLFVINGYAETIEENANATDDIRRDASQIREAGNRAVDLTRQLLAFSRKQIVDPQVIDVAERISTSCKMLSRMIGEDIQIHISNSDAPCNVTMDLIQLDQIVANLLVNARDAMPKGGTIHIHTETKNISDADGQKDAGRRPGEYVVITVKDTGTGIPTENLKNIFEPFYTSKEQGKGTGLGLATVYGIVQQNNGFIDVSSRVNDGTTFCIHVPRSTVSGRTEEQNQKRSSALHGHETILLVEDEAQVRHLVKKQLESAGYRVFQAANAKKALVLFEHLQERIDLLLSDVVMPGMSGVEMVKQITARFGSPSVIFMSGHNEELTDTHGVSASPHPFISKPFTARDLCSRIRTVLDSRTARGSSSAATG